MKLPIPPLILCIFGLIMIMKAGMEIGSLVIGMPLVVAALQTTDVAYLIPYYPFLVGFQIAWEMALGACVIAKAIEMEGDSK